MGGSGIITHMPIRWSTIFFDIPDRLFDDGVAFWGEVTASTLSRYRGLENEFATLLPADGDAYLRVQRVREGDGGIHLDLHFDGREESLDAAATRAVTLGARPRHREDNVVVLDSPGGFTFCLVSWDGQASVPSPVRLDHGAASRLDQLALDIPPVGFESECSFWSSLTGWELHTGSRPEFASLQRPSGIPVRILLQRLDTAEPDARVTAHVDLACTDRAGLAATQVAAGAKIQASYPNWMRMIDPIGRPYCLTGRDPETGQLPGTPHPPAALS
jgi:hypothetical protein